MLFMLMSKREGPGEEQQLDSGGSSEYRNRLRMQDMNWDTGSDSGLAGLLVNLA